jgi:TonB-dependent starch-binding outer membrane protein SusC
MVVWCYFALLSGTAAQRALTGEVVDATTQERLAYATIAVKNGNTGTSADDNGTFRLSVPEGPVTLGVSLTGYTTLEVDATAQTNLIISLSPDANALKEVVVVGYGKQSKRDVTGAVSTVKSADLVPFKAQSFDAMLQGKAAGVQVNQASGIPGAPVRVLIRGTATVSATAEPLFVIDGIPIDQDVSGVGGGSRGASSQNALASINPNDIESIEVLKDAAATAIYGSRGANGVVLITTKTGQLGRGTLTVDVSSGMSQVTRTAADVGLASGPEWLQLINEGRANVGLGTLQAELDASAGSPTQQAPLPALRGVSGKMTSAQLADTRWYDEILRNGSFREVNLSTSRGTEKSSIFMSANYRNDEGVLKNNSFDRYTFRLNAEHEVFDNLRMGMRLSLAHTKNNRVMNGGGPSGNEQIAGAGYSAAVSSALPIYPVYNNPAEGPASGYFFPFSGVNPVANSDRDLFKDQLQTYRVLGNLYAEYAIPAVKGLSVRTEVATDINYVGRLFFSNAALRPTAINYAENATSLGTNINYNLYASYARDFGKRHSISLVAGTERQEFATRGSNLFGEAIPGTNQDFGAPTVVLRLPSAGLGGERKILSYFGRLNYKLNNRYLLGLSTRRDGTSIFQESNRFNWFPGVSVGWIASEENFIKNIRPISFLKMRASYGATGNQGIPTDATFTTGVTWPVYGSNSAVVLSRAGSQDLVWETTQAYDAGIDFGLFGGRITGSAEYYQRYNTDLLFAVPVTPSVGFAFGGNVIWDNVGTLRNQGWEFTLNTINVQAGDFTWSTSANFTTMDSRLLSINPTLDARGAGIAPGATRNAAGKRLGTYFVAEYAGVDAQSGIPMIYETDRELFNTTGRTARTGNVIPATTANMQNHRMLQDDKTTLPTFIAGLTNTFSFKGIELLAQFAAQGGNYLYDNSEVGRTMMGDGGGNLSRDLIGNSWQRPGDQTKYPMLMWNNRSYIDNNGNPRLTGTGARNFDQNYSVSVPLSRYLYRGDFVRLRTLQLAYTLPKSMFRNVKLQNIRVYLTGNNLLTFTAFPGWDPEQLNAGGGREDRNLAQGGVGNTLPQLKTYLGGITVTF